MFEMTPEQYFLFFNADAIGSTILWIWRNMECIYLKQKCMFGIILLKEKNFNLVKISNGVMGLNENTSCF